MFTPKRGHSPQSLQHTSFTRDRRQYTNHFTEL